MKLKIISDGTTTGTRVVNAETGDELEGVIGVTWSCDLRRSGNEAFVSLCEVQMDAEVLVRQFPGYEER